MKEYINIDKRQLKRLETVRDGYKRLYEQPSQCRPMIIINVVGGKTISWEEKLADPLVMLRAKLDDIKLHLAVEDDIVPAVRVDFGTGIIASAFGCEITYPENNLPAVKSHPVENTADIYRLEKPRLDAGLIAKAFEWIRLWKENLPDWIRIQPFDIQGPFNNAHLIRGNDILLDFYDDAAAVERLLDIITDYTIDLVREMNKLIDVEDGWFCDWGGAYWKGAARISNCSTDMISPQFYIDHVFDRDVRLLSSVGGGRMHYCGGHGDVIDEFFKNPDITGLDIDASIHDLWETAKRVPEKLVLVFQDYNGTFPCVPRLLDGDWPKKRNIVLITNVESVEEGRDLRAKLLESMPY
jgi:hypothetical protein